MQQMSPGSLSLCEPATKDRAAEDRAAAGLLLHGHQIQADMPARPTESALLPQMAVREAEHIIKPMSLGRQVPLLLQPCWNQRIAQGVIPRIA